VSESTPYGRPHPALLAVDGNGMVGIQTGGCAITGNATNPWWAVDLGANMTVASVLLTLCE